MVALLSIFCPPVPQFPGERSLLLLSGSHSVLFFQGPQSTKLFFISLSFQPLSMVKSFLFQEGREKGRKKGEKKKKRKTSLSQLFLYLSWNQSLSQSKLKLSAFLDCIFVHLMGSPAQCSLRFRPITQLKLLQLMSPCC